MTTQETFFARTERVARAFTLVEMIVAIAAVAIVAVGLAAIFDTVGKTVTGGKRVSVLNNYAGLIESRMRRDFEAMTRDGFLVIRQQWVQPNPNGTFNPAVDRVAVSPDDTTPQPRRADEIMFFVRSPTESARQPLSPSMTARGDSARIHYGHGQMRIVQPNPLAAGGVRPMLNERNSTVDRLGAAGGANLNPNRYAGDWTLLRLETVLTKPDVAIRGLPAAPPGVNVNQMADRDRQIALQPAAPSIFRYINYRNASPADAPMVRQAEPFRQFASGLVDIATTELEEIRAFVVGIPGLPGSYPPASAEPLPNHRYDPAPLPGAVPRTRPGTPDAVDLMHAQMEQAMPAQSAASLLVPNGVYGVANDPAGVRVRYERDARQLLTEMGDPANNTAPLLATRRADQVMLCSQNFLPRCSEMIVEWSFGETDIIGQVVWHGPDRWADSNGNHLPDAGEPMVVSPYPYNAGNNHEISIEYPRVGTAVPGNHLVSDRLIYGRTPSPDDAVLTSYFGYADPTFQPPQDNNGDGDIDAGQPAVGGVPWAWPRLIRVTLTLSDAQRPEIESTFQFVFGTPGD